MSLSRYYGDMTTQEFAEMQRGRRDRAGYDNMTPEQYADYAHRLGDAGLGSEVVAQKQDTTDVLPIQQPEGGAQ